MNSREASQNYSDLFPLLPNSLSVRSLVDKTSHSSQSLSQGAEAIRSCSDTNSCSTAASNSIALSAEPGLKRKRSRHSAQVVESDRDTAQEPMEKRLFEKSFGCISFESGTRSSRRRREEQSRNEFEEKDSSLEKTEKVNEEDKSFSEKREPCVKKKKTIAAAALYYENNKIEETEELPEIPRCFLEDKSETLEDVGEDIDMAESAEYGYPTGDDSGQEVDDEDKNHDTGVRTMDQRDAERRTKRSKSVASSASTSNINSSIIFASSAPSLKKSAEYYSSSRDNRSSKKLGMAPTSIRTAAAAAVAAASMVRARSPSASDSESETGGYELEQRVQRTPPLKPRAINSKWSTAEMCKRVKTLHELLSKFPLGSEGNISVSTIVATLIAEQQISGAGSVGSSSSSSSLSSSDTNGSSCLAGNGYGSSSNNSSNNGSNCSSRLASLLPPSFISQPSFPPLNVQQPPPPPTSRQVSDTDLDQNLEATIKMDASRCTSTSVATTVSAAMLEFGLAAARVAAAGAPPSLSVINCINVIPTPPASSSPSPPFRSLVGCGGDGKDNGGSYLSVGLGCSSDSSSATVTPACNASKSAVAVCTTSPSCCCTIISTTDSSYNTAICMDKALNRSCIKCNSNHPSSPPSTQCRPSTSVSGRHSPEVLVAAIQAEENNSTDIATVDDDMDPKDVHSVVVALEAAVAKVDDGGDENEEVVGDDDKNNGVVAVAESKVVKSATLRSDGDTPLLPCFSDKSLDSNEPLVQNQLHQQETSVQIYERLQRKLAAFLERFST